MFGYVLPDKNKIKDEQRVLYSAFYCGLCKQIGKDYTQICRYTTNYDITFFAALAFDQMNLAVKFNKERCIGNPFAKRVVIASNPLLKRIAALNIIFSFYKATDNVIDNGGLKAKTARKLLNKSFVKASALEPRLDEIIKNGYNSLRECEKQNETSIDKVSHCFAQLLKECASEILGEKATDNTLRLVYNVGKFVYLTDALDDITEDYKAKRYNPILAALNGFNGDFNNRQQFIKDNLDTLTFIFATTVNRAIECFNGMDFYQCFSLIQNIVYYGLRKKTDELLSSKKKLKKPKH